MVVTIPGADYIAPGKKRKNKEGKEENRNRIRCRVAKRYQG
jgi:hypothetical protein